ncbi:hypothetical protein GCM10029976_031310 [Kribbella albertanoniae]|uniref:Glycoside hydrolase family 42 N-terminal domain-containing protein n=1 Tax=Kribbella albertanoniae TaxID=1266829 RepID=A0A4R4QIE0_9ACTN|nr:hypothetical protein [Kribbella albertanoniae]TDC35043.1 hypothetical protein E1261_02380 [Kribbella albertanoniae]
MKSRALRRAVAGAGAGIGLVLVTELRLGPAGRPLTERWRSQRVEPSKGTQLGLSFRPRQCEDLSLDPQETLRALLPYPFDILRLAAYWDRITPTPGVLDHSELDWQLDEAERAGKKVIVNLGAVKSFGYPEYFVPAHVLTRPLPEGTLITPATHPHLLKAACQHLTELVRRYRGHRSIIAWQVEHDAVDPLGMEHSWRLSRSFVRDEIRAVRAADPDRPILLNGFLPMSTAVTAHQWWRTLDQGDSVDIALEYGDIVGIDSYPRHAIAALGSRALYLDGAAGWLPRLRRGRVLRRVADSGRQVMVTEGQAEPWEAVTVPPDPREQAAASCPPERVIENYSRWQRWAAQSGTALDAYLFWGAEYWVLRSRGGDDSYLAAFARALTVSGHADRGTGDRGPVAGQAGVQATGTPVPGWPGRMAP